MSSETRSLKEVIASEKGRLDHIDNTMFCLHVFWQVPSAAAATELLGGLRGCARATRRCTPTTPTYFFRVSTVDSAEAVALFGEPPKTAGEHPHIAEAQRKLKAGVPLVAVRQGLEKRGLKAEYLELDPAAPLPDELLNQRIVAVECTEVYLDDRAFIEHAGSREYLDAYAVVMKPSLSWTRPQTFRFGTPTPKTVDTILEPILLEQPVPFKAEGCRVWQRPAPPEDERKPGLFFSFDTARTLAALPPAFIDGASTCVTLPHPFRADSARWMVVHGAVPSAEALAALAATPIQRGEVYVSVRDADDAAMQTAAAADVSRALAAAGLGQLAVNAGENAGYVLHERASELFVGAPEKATGAASS